MKTVAEVIELIERAPSEADAGGIAQRFRDVLAPPEATQQLLQRLDDRRYTAQRHRQVYALIDQMRREHAVQLTFDLEAATQAVLNASSLSELFGVTHQHPIIFTAPFLNTLAVLRNEAVKQQEVYTAGLIQSRRDIAAIQLAQLQGLKLDEASLRSLVFQLLEARSFHDLLALIGDNPLVLAEAFDSVLTEMAKEGAQQGQTKLPQVARLRLAVIAGLRNVVETVVKKREAAGGPDDAAKELGQALEADKFLAVVARYPFVLGEDFGAILAREINHAKVDGDDKAVQGLERRVEHLRLIARIVTRLGDVPAFVGGGDSTPSTDKITPPNSAPPTA
jgi:hypothetical protein